MVFIMYVYIYYIYIYGLPLANSSGVPEDPPWRVGNPQRSSRKLQLHPLVKHGWLVNPM